ncbi:SGNH/GDSL hydrolase family protein [Actinoplanes sp. KI2]|uniref:SGNH/GDSL hydrolase family protein n=1 Tax=Actinoplanes sp. KI2 TaxID=2983315 RepID=UPI0021D5E8A1|nr:SGNH/GDSL hydrolase family protein [Actinoplanes sp. KI2]MCU7729125.1 SGNH/GDSL hydrolase family protein [Actinoplanes sp. KI2]
MSAHAARGRRAGGYAIAGVLVAATLLLVAGPQAARALSRSASPAAAPVATPSPASAAETKSPYRVVGLGDSVPAGSACDCASYVSLVGRHEARRMGRDAVVSNLAEGGLTTAGLLDQLADAAVRRRVAAADLVIITVGANDFDTGSVADDSCGAPGLDCFRSTLQRQAARLDAVLDRVDALLGDRSAAVLVTGYWNVFLDGDVAAARGDAYVRNSVALTRAENDQIAAAARGGGATYVDLYTAFKGADGTKNDTALLAGDGDHPDAAGHREIADAVESALALA